MKFIKYLLTGILFGIILTKSEAASWYRIYEMFSFQSFHMYGIIGSAVISGTLVIGLIKKFSMHSINGELIEIAPKDKGLIRYIAGGTLFGLGWAMTGACPGPMFTIVGQGHTIYILVILSATIGAFLYGLVRHKLPH